MLIFRPIVFVIIAIETLFKTCTLVYCKEWCGRFYNDNLAAGCMMMYTSSVSNFIDYFLAVFIWGQLKKKNQTSTFLSLFFLWNNVFQLLYYSVVFNYLIKWIVCRVRNILYRLTLCNIIVSLNVSLYQSVSLSVCASLSVSEYVCMYELLVYRSPAPRISFLLVVSWAPRFLIILLVGWDVFFSPIGRLGCVLSPIGRVGCVLSPIGRVRLRGSSQHRRWSRTEGRNASVIVSEWRSRKCGTNPDNEDKHSVLLFNLYYNIM